jgi:hypothetical protein
VGPLQVGATLSQKYKIVRLLAESGGVVLYEGTDTARSQRVWIKILQREALNDPDALERFQREAGGAKVLDVGKNPAGLPYMVATEFKSDKEKPPLPTRVKTTLPGVAPPPPRLPREEEEEAPPSSSIPLSAEDVVLVTEETPAPEAILSPLSSTPAALSPLITTPPAPLEREPVEEATVPLPTRPMQPPPRKPASAVPTVFIEGRGRKQSTTGMWVSALVMVASLSGVIGYSLARKESRPPQETSATATATATATQATATATATVPETATATTPPPPATSTATETAPIATVTPTATLTTPVTVTPAVTATVAIATATQTATHAPVVRPPTVTTHRPPPTTHTSSGDPLTL